MTDQPKPAPTATQPKTLCPECYGNGRVLSVCDDCSGTGFEITPAPTAPREYAIPDEECLPKYFKEPAPTAEEQLAERISEIESRIAAATPFARAQ